ncbi:MAG: cation:proton antiporter [Gammaproteobacteria bacterium]|nr:cation:proton antiporter [Gammaproteobacteria bacterium]
MESSAITLITFGGLLLSGLLIEAIGRLTPLPRVSLLIAFGLLVGNSGLALLPDQLYDWFGLIADMALLMVGFLLGGKFSRDYFNLYGRAIFIVSLAVTLVTLVLVSGILVAFGFGITIALLMGAIATATDPAAVSDVVKESSNDSRFSRVILGVVAIDDAWGLIVFSLILAFVEGIGGQSGVSSTFAHGAKELFGAIILGGLLGLPMAYLSGRIRDGEPTVSEAIGMVFLCGGLARYFEVSHLLSAIVMGVVVVNMASHHTRPFHAIEHIERPFLSVFFLLAGAVMDFDVLVSVGILGVVYIVARIISRITGGFIGGKLAGMSVLQSVWIGPSLMPQAGVAVGMALVASEKFPDLSHILLTSIIATTVFFELIGPVLTKMSLLRESNSQQN